MDCPSCGEGQQCVFCGADIPPAGPAARGLVLAPDVDMLYALDVVLGLARSNNFQPPDAPDSLKVVQELRAQIRASLAA